MSKSAWIQIIFGNACSTLGLWLEKIGGSEIFLILIPYLGPLVHTCIVPSQSISSSPRHRYRQGSGSRINSQHYANIFTWKLKYFCGCVCVPGRCVNMLMDSSPCCWWLLITSWVAVLVLVRPRHGSDTTQYTRPAPVLL